MLNKQTRLLLQGFPLGVANTLPGISGGTVAIILYIYEPLLRAIKKIDLRFLIPFGLGAAGGAFFGAVVMGRLFNLYTAAVYSFIAGMILASTRVTIKEAGGFRKNNKILLDIAAILFGFALAYYFSANQTAAAVTGSTDYFQIFIGGLLGSMTMILPGISGGTVLVILGVYRPVLTAISTFDILALGAFGIGLVIGLILFAWLISWLLKSLRRPMMMILSGLILGSVPAVIPGYFGQHELFFFLLGFVLVLLFTMVTARQKGK
ncbi:MAG: DUF368 domain-containing protein [Bacillota bacterium]